MQDPIVGTCDAVAMTHHCCAIVGVRQPQMLGGTRLSHMMQSDSRSERPSIWCLTVAAREGKSGGGKRLGEPKVGDLTEPRKTSYGFPSACSSARLGSVAQSLRDLAARTPARAMSSPSASSMGASGGSAQKRA